MTWNYRVIVSTENDEQSFFIHEVYYKEDGSIDMWSEDPTIPFGNSPEELIQDLNMRKRALSRPFLQLKNDRLIPYEEFV